MSDTLGKVIPFRRRETKTEMPATPATFKEFADAILIGDFNGAAASLTRLFDVPKELALHCATAFHGKVKSDPDLFAKTILLQARLEKGEMNKAMETLSECFDVHGLEALQVLTGLITKFGKAEPK